MGAAASSRSTAGTMATPKRQGGRPKKEYSPRTKHTLDNLRKSKNRLRRNLLKASQKPDCFNLTRPQVIQGASKFLSKGAQDLLKVQLYLQPMNKFGRRWPDEFKPFALNLYFQSPSAYKYLAKYLSLPSVRSLKNWLSHIAIHPGVAPNIIKTVVDRIHDWPLKDRACILMLGEIVLKENLFYDTKSDMVNGFADSGKERTHDVANSGLVMMLAGISKPWVQPLAFILSKSKASPECLQDLLIEVIQSLSSGGIFVKAVVCDQGASNCTLARRLGVTPDHPFFLVGDTQVYFLFDTPHLLKCTRNNLRKHDLQIYSKLIRWKYIVDFYKNKHPLRLRLAKKLTDKHIYQTPFGNMKVQFAAQVFSDTLSVSLATLLSLNELPPEAQATCDFLEHMKQIFDSLNSSSLECGEQKMRFALSSSSGHINFLREKSSWISKWQFLSPRRPHTVRGWQITINAVLLLWEYLSLNFDFDHLLTRRLNQDPLENLFGMVRQQHGCNETPNSYQFVAGLKHIFLGKMFQLSSRGNCEAGAATLLVELTHLPVSTAASHQPEPLPAIETDELDLPDESYDDLIQENVEYHFAGFLVESFLKKSVCHLCPDLLSAARGVLTSEVQFHALLQARAPGLIFGSFCPPSDSFFQCFRILEQTFLQKINEHIHLPKVAERMVHSLVPHSEEQFCTKECAKQFLNLYVHLRLRWHIRLLNRELLTERALETPAQRKRKKLAP
ncbi:hypothetical protein HPB47_006686 [Ixodes persulcatus]|uniref:Uncharacterized protein n=1 Tax=Ixodes persulcatus TaxID=34615 RepID=A0AC60P9L5_IXOPE|nr:hypothetical protein HPB47_006686 [Ixodes persulcatus]